jgi:hypothetical protein
LALNAISLESGKSPVSPSNAWRFALKHLKPLLPAEHHVVFDGRYGTGWEALSIAYADLASRSMGRDVFLMNMATAIKILHTYTTRPPRENLVVPLLEVAYFHQMSDCLKPTVRPLIESDIERNAAVFRFCIGCWRTSNPNRLLCSEHASVIVDGTLEVSGVVGKEASTHISRRKQAARQKSKFDAAIREMTTNEVLEFHNSNFAADVLFPKSGRCDWLARRRPNVWRLLTDAETTITDENVVPLLLKLLHNPPGRNESVRRVYDGVNQILLLEPELIWPMVLRAEAWHKVRNAVQQGRGGLRKNAGRPKKSHRTA